MKKTLSKLLGIALLCTTTIGCGALISHLVLSNNSESNIQIKKDDSTSIPRLKSAKHKFLTASYDFRNSIQSLRKFKNNDSSDCQSLKNFIDDSNQNLYDEDSPMVSELSDFNSTTNTYIDEDTQEEVTETIFSYENVYKGNGGLRLGTGSGENNSYFIIQNTSSNNYITCTSVKLYVTTYNTVINGVDHYDDVSLAGYGTVSGDAVIELDAYDNFGLNITSGRLIIYQADFYFDYYGYFDFIDMDDVPEGVDYSFESVGSFKYVGFFDEENLSIALNNETNEIEIGTYDYFESLSSSGTYSVICLYNDGSFTLPFSDFSFLIVLKGNNFVLHQEDDYLRYPSLLSGLCINNSSEFYVFKKVSSINPHGPQY